MPCRLRSGLSSVVGADAVEVVGYFHTAQVRCKSGLVYANGTTVFNTTQGYNLPAHAPNATDDSGRK